MVHGQRAPVRPRVISASSNDIFPLEDEVAQFLEAGARGLIALVGPPGSGKTTAIQHLAAVFPLVPGLLLVDDSAAATAPVAASVRLVVYTAEAVLPLPHLAMLRLVAWGQDDLIEYLLNIYPARCAAVMARVHKDDYEQLGGVPELWRRALDRLALNDTVPTASAALRGYLEGSLNQAGVLATVRAACLHFLISSDQELTKAFGQLGRSDDNFRLVRHPPAQRMLAIDHMVAALHGNDECTFLTVRLPRDLVGAAAAELAHDPSGLDHLYRLLTGPTNRNAMTASLLHAAGTGWAPSAECKPVLAGAYLGGASWPGVDVAGADLQQADLSAADLTGANLARANARQGNFRRARLQGSSLEGLLAGGADLAGADLSGAYGSDVRFDDANLEDACLDQAVLPHASFAGANLTNATFRGADLPQARFTGRPQEMAPPTDPRSSQLAGAVFTHADLTESELSGLCLRKATWTGTSFPRAKLAGCDLEGLQLPHADFSAANLQGALLTDTIMPDANFMLANLREAGLAEINWEGADLRGADLRGCSFHLGSSRSGLVGSPIACEGSKTGFYTDEYEEQTYKSPEEIRKANLCRADLRGAKLDDVDFYLVDLRGAIFDPLHEPHLRRCGAILETRAP